MQRTQPGSLSLRAWQITVLPVLLLFMRPVDSPASERLNPDLINCADSSSVSLQVLGSGGPIADDGRASSSYLLWVDGESRFLVDAGGGSFLRFGEAGADFEELEHIGISHFHTDHSSDLVALLKSGYFSERRRALSISGPSAGGDYPGMEPFLDRLLNPESGAYAYLGGYLNGSDGLVKLNAIEVEFEATDPQMVYEDASKGIQVHAMGVPHGPVPALAYRVRVEGKTVVFSGDHNGDSDEFIRFARNANVLVMHMPVHEEIQGAGRKLHAPPGRIGKIASLTNADTLVLSHFMARSLRRLNDNLGTVKESFKGRVLAANDLDCIDL